jgi:hypothetical protein
VATLADESQSLLARSASTAATSRLLNLRAGAQNSNTNNHHNHNKGLSSTHVEQSLKIVLDILTTTCRVVLPPVVAVTQMVTDLYRVLPRDALLAQAGLVYCLAGGYFPTLFCAVSAAQQCGMAVVLDATTDLVEEAVRAVDAATSTTSWSSGGQASNTPTARELLQQKTLIVLATIDPVKINQAVGALAATWMGVAAVLEREFARTITLSLTLAGYLRPVTRWLLAPPLYHIVPDDYHAWVPVVLGWSCKAASMSLAWRIQRVFTAASSAVAGGLLCSRALLRMAARRLPWLQRRTQDGDETATYIDELLGFALAGLGLYVQIGNGFSFQVPFPLNLVTWPFEIAERYVYSDPCSGEFGSLCV